MFYRAFACFVFGLGDTDLAAELPVPIAKPVPTAKAIPLPHHELSFQRNGERWSGNLHPNSIRALSCTERNASRRSE
jgi:hypothetical protein